MDPNAQYPQQTVNTQPVQSQVPPTVTTLSPLPKIVITILGVIIVLGFIGGAYYLGTQRNIPVSSNQIRTAMVPTKSINAAPTSIPTLAEVATTWKTYTSTVEKASFKYPTDWIITKPAIQSNAPGADEIGIQSPNGTVKISWVSALSGFGGGCSSTSPLGSSESGLQPCPLITIIDTTPIKNAPDLFVVTGTITKDGLTYQPFIAVQDSKGLVKTQRSMGYDMFMGRNNGSLSGVRGQNTNVLFSTGNAYAGGPSLTQNDANTWLNKPEVQQAKQILLSLTY